MSTSIYFRSRNSIHFRPFAAKKRCACHRPHSHFMTIITVITLTLSTPLESQRFVYDNGGGSFLCHSQTLIKHSISNSQNLFRLVVIANCRNSLKMPFRRLSHSFIWQFAGNLILAALMLDYFI